MQQVDPPTLEGYNPLEPSFMRDPGPVLARARSECPVFYYPDLAYWVVTRYEDVAAALNDWQTFSQKAMELLPVPPQIADHISEDWFFDTFLSLDPPEHTVSRKAVNKVVTRGRVRDMVPTIETIANHLIDGFVDRGSCDLMNDFSYQLSLRTIVHMLGLPDRAELLPKYKSWAEDLLVLLAPRRTPGEGPLRTMDEAERLKRWSHMQAAHEFLYDLLEQRRAAPADDLVSDLLALTDDSGEPAMSDSRIVAHMIEMITAGTDTTANLIGQVLIQLSEHPEHVDAVRANPSLLENAIEETLRYRGIAMGLFRWTTRDVEISGVTIPANSRVHLLVQSAGRDEDRFRCPHEYDIEREDAGDHVNFGRGRHLCLGAPLARVEARVALETLLRRLPELRVDAEAEPQYRPSLTAFLLEALPVHWTVAKQ